MVGTAAGGLADPTRSGLVLNNFVVDDWNGDGVPDVVFDGTSGVVRIYPGMGKGAFGQAATVATPVAGTLMTKGDFDGDGKTDLFLFDATSVDPLVLYGDGRGNVTASAAAPDTLMIATDVRVADLNGDGKDDAVVVKQFNSSQMDYLTVMLGGGDRTLTPLPMLTPAATDVIGYVIVDIDHDRKPDLVVVTEGTTTPSLQVTVLRGNGDGTFGAGVTTPLTDAPTDVVAADVDGDGAPELVLVGTTLQVWNLSLTSPLTMRSLYAYGGEHLVSADLNGDGQDDLVVGQQFAGAILLMHADCP